MARVFHASSDANIPVETVDSASAVASHFLTIKDRSQLESLYEYASANSIDLNHVDAVASDLASYRQIGGTPVGQRYDVNGYGVKYNFVPSDEQLANRILASSLMSDTSLDHGFIKNLLDPNQSPTHVSEFKFLEKAMSVFSPSGGNDASTSDASKAGQYFENATVWGHGEHYVFETKMPDIKLDLSTGELVDNSKNNASERLELSSDALSAGPEGLQKIKSQGVQYLLDAFVKGSLESARIHARPLGGVVGTNLYAKHQSLK